VVAFFEELLVHTKGQWARRRFILEDWQRDEIIRPLFGRVVWSAEWGCYVRQHRVAWIELGRKNGKSELAAGIALYLLVGDDEEGAEIYGGARDTKQARKIWDVANRMRALSGPLQKRLGVNRHEKRIFDEQTASYYEVIPEDELGELGANPHGVVIDELLALRTRGLWDAMRTAMGSRLQPLMVGLSTAGNDPSSWFKAEHDEMARIAEQPARAPHVFVYLRNTPEDADPWDEGNWFFANPALGRFLSIEVLREEALEAKNDPTKENRFRQFRLNQHVQQTTRWMPLHLWDASSLEVAPTPAWVLGRLKGREGYCGLDLSSKLDMSAWTVSVPLEGGRVGQWWRFWLPEAVLPQIDDRLGGQPSLWVRDGWLKLTEGNVIDYDQIYADIEADAGHFTLIGAVYDRWSGEPVRQELEKRLGIEMFESSTTYERMTDPMTELMKLIRSQQLEHYGNPVARWCADSIEKRSPTDNPDLMKPVKPDRLKVAKRIDGMVSSIMSIDCWRRLADVEDDVPVMRSL
jgi:phage terminase large subunit-like protein